MSSSSCPSIHDDTRFHRRPVHSFRIGAATSAAKAGIEDSTIHMLGRWSSSAFLVYIVPLENNNLQEVSNSITIGQIIKLLLYSKLLIEMMLVIYTQKGGIGEVV